MRERKRDWPVIAYKFWARPIGDLPEEFWNVAHRMNDLWNTLIDNRTLAREKSGAVEDKEKQKEIWNSFWNDVGKYVRDSDLSWELKGEILDRFTTASGRAIKEHLELKRHYGLHRVTLPHRFTGGGIPIARIFKFDSTAKRLKIRPVPAHAYHNNARARTRQRLTRGLYGLGDSAKIEFETILHRRIPQGAVLKKSYWVGQFNRSLPESKRWTWSLQLLCEVPTSEYVRERAGGDDRPSCGLDLGWRIMSHGEYLRIGMIVDSLGCAIELRLPLGMQRKRDQNKRDWIASLHDLIALDSKIGKEVDAAKAKATEMLADRPPGFDKMRQSGLRKLLRESTHQGLIETLSEWDERDRKLGRIRAVVWGKMRRRKTWLYQNFAAWLVSTYGTVILEGNVSLKEISMRSEPGALKNAAKYRQWAGLGELRIAIKNAAKKYGCEVIEAESFNTTRRCFICSAEHKGDKAKLYLECSKGHRWDQDINAARNLLKSQFNALREQELRKDGIGNKLPVEIPENLKMVVVQCFVE